MIKKLINFFTQPTEITKGKTPEGICPNCWGEQEYDSMIREMYVDMQIDINNHKANYSFIQDFVVTNLKRIIIKKILKADYLRGRAKGYPPTGRQVTPTLFQPKS